MFICFAYSRLNDILNQTYGYLRYIETKWRWFLYRKLEIFANNLKVLGQKMIESCNARRMLIGIGILGGLTLIVLIVESRWTTNTHINSLTNTSNDCWIKEKFQIIEECHPCTNFEVASKSVEACFETKYKEVLQCEITGKVQRSCEKVAWIEERHFWVFEGLMFAVAVLSYCVVFARQRILNRRVKSRIQKQLANGLSN